MHDDTPSAPDPSFHEKVLAETTRIVRRRRRARTVGRITAGAGCYLAGLATMAWIAAAPGPADSTDPPAPTAIAAADDEAAHSDRPTADTAADAPRDEFDELRRLGDFHLIERGDPKAAVDYYRRALRLAADEQRPITEREGTWMFQALARDWQRRANDEAHDS